MTEKDISEKMLEDYEDVFADIVNVLLLGGKEIILPGNLKEVSINSGYRDNDSILREQERDIIKKWVKGNINLAMIGIENQSKPEKYMTARVIGYDGASYKSQAIDYKEAEKGQKIPVAPVLTFVLYYGKDRWNYPTNLKEEIDVPEIFDEFVNDYKIKVFEISWLSPEQVSMFKSDFKVVANFFVKKRIDPDYIPDDPTEIKHVDAVLKLISVMSGDKRYIEIPRKEKVKNMCEVADRLENRGIAKGEERATYRYISEGYLPAEVGAKELGVSLEQLYENMEKAGYEIKK
jgi:hypothetical protein